MSKKASLKVEYEVEVKDKNGKVIHKEKKECKSFVTNFIKWLRSKFTRYSYNGYEYFGEEWTANDIGNVGRTFPREAAQTEMYYGTMFADAAEEDCGIRVGTSDTVESPADYELKAKIVHGAGSGQMLYGLQTVEAVEVVGDESRFRVTRTFTNNSGAIITVKEIGCAMGQMEKPSPYSQRYLLILRDVLVSPSSVPDGATLTVRYRIIVTV